MLMAKCEQEVYCSTVGGHFYWWVYDYREFGFFTFERLPEIPNIRVGSPVTLEHAFICESHPFNQSLE